MTYFDLREGEKALIRKEALERYISEEPKWLRKYSTWVAGLPDVGYDAKLAIPFACDLIASRLTRQRQNQVSTAKKKQKNKRSRGKGGNKDGQTEDQDQDKPRKRQRTQESESDAMACNVCHSELKLCCIACELAQTTSVLFQSMG